MTEIRLMYRTSCKHCGWTVLYPAGQGRFHAHETTIIVDPDTDYSCVNAGVVSCLTRRRLEAAIRKQEGETQ